jgi:AcrR family transcriptional regulator
VAGGGTGSSAGRVSYREVARNLKRDAVLDAMHELLLTRSWSSIKLSDVAGAAGISRQTLYNEFGSRQGLAQGYALRLTDRFADKVEDAINANVGNVHAAFVQGFRDFFTDAASDPLVVSLITGEAKPELLRIVTTDSGPILAHGTQRLSALFTSAWVAVSREDAAIASRAVVRLALSYVSMPPEDTNDVAADLARLLTPFVERYGVIETN